MPTATASRMITSYSSSRFFGRQLLGIVQIQDFTVARQNDRTCDHRARQRASSDLVDAADPAKILIFVLVDLHLFRALALFFQGLFLFWYF